MKTRDLSVNRYGGYVIVTQDGGAGSSGKGALNSWLASKVLDFEWSVCNWSPNAGHYVETDDGKRILTQHIPSAFINPAAFLFLNAGGMIDIEVLSKELDALEKAGFQVRGRFVVHPMVAVITEHNREHERATLQHGSTFKGCGSATSRKAMRHQPLARDFKADLINMGVTVGDMTDEILSAIRDGENVLVEGAQGMDLDLNQGEYPYCTSRCTWPNQLLNDACIPASVVSDIIINIRPNPIRISNESAADGSHKFSGNYWDADEITWDEVARRGGFTSEEFSSLYMPALITSVTKKVRRVFEFPVLRFQEMWSRAGGPDGGVLLSLNFANWIDKDLTGATTVDSIKSSTKLRHWFEANLTTDMCENLFCVRTGSPLSQCVDVSDMEIDLDTRDRL